MPTPFDKIGYSDAQQIVSFANQLSQITGLAVSPIVGHGVADSSPRRTDLAGGIDLIRRMLDGDMWLSGLGWMGPRPQPTEDGYNETMVLLAQGFVSQNALADVIERHVSGVLGNEPRWGLAPRRLVDPEAGPTTEQQALIDEAEDALTEWWDARKVHKMLINAARTLLFARRAPVRLYVPRGKLARTNVQDENGRARTIAVVPVSDGDVPGGLAVIWPEDPRPERATVAQDTDTKDFVGIALFRGGAGVPGMMGASAAGNEMAEMSYLTDSTDTTTAKPFTVIRQAKTGGAADAGMARLRLGGRLPMYEMQRDPFVTPQMIQLQRALNLALSALPRNVITSGWLERVITNAQMPGKFVSDPEARGGKRFVPDKHTTGAGVTTYLKGLKQEDVGTGTMSYASPGVTFREPSPVAPTIEAFEGIYRALLREAKQEHVLMSQDIKASGKSREQARADFEMTLRPTAAELNACGRWLVETALAMAEEFAGTPGRFTAELRGVFECQINTGPITADERTSIDASVAAGTLSIETAMVLEGVADTGAEMSRIAGQPGARLDIASKQLTAVGAAAANGLDIQTAGEVVGLEPAIAKKLVSTVDPSNPGAGDPANADPNGPAGGNGGDPNANNGGGDGGAQ